MYDWLIKRTSTQKVAFFQGLSASIGIAGFVLFVLGLVCFFYMVILWIFGFNDFVGKAIFEILHLKIGAYIPEWAFILAIILGTTGLLIMKIAGYFHDPLHQEFNQRFYYSSTAVCRYETKKRDEAEWLEITFEDRYDHYKPKPELKSGEFNYFRLIYTQKNFFYKKLMIKEITVSQFTHLDRDATVESCKTESYVVLNGIGSFTSCEEGSQKYKDKFHTSFVPTLSSFGHPKTPLTKVCICPNMKSDEAYSVQFEKNYGYINRGRRLPISVLITIFMPQEEIDKIVSLLHQDNIDALTFYIHIITHGFYTSQSDSDHTKILFAGDSVDERIEDKTIFEVSSLDPEKLKDVEFYDGQKIKLLPDKLGGPITEIITKQKSLN